MLCSVLEAILVKRGIDMTMDTPKYLLLVTQIFAFAFVWSIGGNVTDKDHVKFDQFVREHFENEQYVK